MIHRDLFGHLFLALLVSIAAGVFAWIGLVSPERLGWPSKNPIIVMVILLILGGLPLLWFLAFRLHLRSLWVYRNTTPVTMHLQIQVDADSDSTAYYALLRPAAESQQVQRIPVYPPRWDIQVIGSDAAAQVYIDPGTSRPLVIEIDGRRLWAMGI